MVKFTVLAGKGWAEFFRITDDGNNDAPAKFEHGIQVDLKDSDGKTVASGTDQNHKVTVLDVGELQVAFSCKELVALSPGDYSVVAAVGVPNDNIETINLGVLTIVGRG